VSFHDTSGHAMNPPISGQPLSCMSELVRSLAFVKTAAAHANAALGLLDADPKQALGVMTAAELQALLLPEMLTRPSRLTG
jgi:aspartate ammonia-lyase